MIFGFLLLIAIVGILFYLLVIYREVPGAVEQRLGTLEALPEDVGKWKTDSESEEGRAAAKRGQRREVRIWHDPNSGGLFRKQRLVRQVRYRNAATNAIERVEPEEIIVRKRVKQS